MRHLLMGELGGGIAWPRRDSSNQTQ